jgi:hypothetical protein
VNLSDRRDRSEAMQLFSFTMQVRVDRGEKQNFYFVERVHGTFQKSRLLPGRARRRHGRMPGYFVSTLISKLVPISSPLLKNMSSAMAFFAASSTISGVSASPCACNPGTLSSIVSANFAVAY